MKLRVIGLCSLLLILSLGQQALADVRIVVAVGNNIGAPGEEPLRFAEQDAERVREVFSTLGRVERGRVFLLQGRSREQLRATFAEVRGRSAELTRQGQEVTFIFYYAGHGDADALHLGRTRIERAELLRWIEEIPSALRIVVIDACRAAVSRTRGVRRGESFNVYVDEEAAGRGTVVLSSSSEGEAAQESDLLGGALFTHYFVSGLRGAADEDSDGRVTIAEVYAYTYRRTVMRSAGAAPAVQHPAFSFDVAGTGELILTEPVRAEAALELPPGRDVRYQVYRLPAGAVVAEIGSSPTRPVRLAVPPGRLLLQRRSGANYGVVELTVQGGRVRQVGSDEFRAVPYEEVTRRGGRFDLHPTAIGLSGTARVAGLPGGAVWLYGPALDVVRRFDRGLLAATLAVDLGSFDAPWHHVRQLELRGELLGGAWLQLGRTTLRFLLGPRVVTINQRITHQRAAALELIGLDPEQLRWSWAIGGVLAVGLAIPFAQRFIFDLRCHGSVVGQPFSQGDHATWEATFGAGFSAGVSWSP